MLNICGQLLQVLLMLHMKPNLPVEGGMAINSCQRVLLALVRCMSALISSSTQSQGMHHHDTALLQQQEAVVVSSGVESPVHSALLAVANMQQQYPLITAYLSQQLPALFSTATASVGSAAAASSTLRDSRAPAVVQDVISALQWAQQQMHESSKVWVTVATAAVQRLESQLHHAATTHSTLSAMLAAADTLLPLLLAVGCQRAVVGSFLQLTHTLLSVSKGAEGLDSLQQQVIAQLRAQLVALPKEQLTSVVLEILLMPTFAETEHMERANALWVELLQPPLPATAATAADCDTEGLQTQSAERSNMLRLLELTLSVTIDVAFCVTTPERNTTPVALDSDVVQMAVAMQVSAAVGLGPEGVLLLLAAVRQLATAASTADLDAAANRLHRFFPFMLFVQQVLLKAATKQRWTDNQSSAGPWETPTQHQRVGLPGNQGLRLDSQDNALNPSTSTESAGSSFVDATAAASHQQAVGVLHGSSSSGVEQQDITFDVDTEAEEEFVELLDDDVDEDEIEEDSEIKILLDDPLGELPPPPPPGTSSRTGTLDGPRPGRHVAADAAAGATAGGTRAVAYRDAGSSSLDEASMQRGMACDATMSHAGRVRRHSTSSTGSGVSISQRRSQYGSGANSRLSQTSRAVNSNPLTCTYTTSGENFVEQHWYSCYTCGLVDSKGCCTSCMRVCHAGHDVVYSGKSRFFCDCGAGLPSAPPCKCLASASGAATEAAVAACTTAAMATATDGEESWFMGDPLSAAWAFNPETHSAESAAAAAAALVDSDELENGSKSSLDIGLVSRAATALKLALTQELSVPDASTQQQMVTAASVVQDVGAHCVRLIEVLLQWFRHGCHDVNQTDGNWVADALAQRPALLPGGPLLAKDATTGASNDQQQSQATASIAYPTRSSQEPSARCSGDASAPPNHISLPTVLLDDASPLIRLQRIVRLGNMDSGKSRSSAECINAPAEVIEALEGGMVVRRGADCSAAANLLAVCRGQWVGLMDVSHHAAEICGPLVLGEVRFRV